MANVILDWPDGMQESIAVDLVGFLGIDESDAMDAVDLVAGRLVEAIATGQIKVGRTPRNTITGHVTGTVIQTGEIHGGIQL
jgi:predicted transcriptional regulator